MNCLIQFLLGNVLNILVDGQHKILARLRLLLDIRKPLPARIDRDEHLSGTPAQLIIERVFNATESGILHPNSSHHLRRQITRRIETLGLFLKMDSLQVQGLDALDGFVVGFARHPAKGLVIAAVGQHHIVIIAGNAGNQGNSSWKVFHF